MDRPRRRWRIALRRLLRLDRRTRPLDPRDLSDHLLRDLGLLR